MECQERHDSSRHVPCRRTLGTRQVHTAPCSTFSPPTSPLPPPSLPQSCRDHDGKITLEDLIALSNFCRKRSRWYQSFEYSAQLQGLCSLHLWHAISGSNGQELFVNWYVTITTATSNAMTPIIYQFHTPMQDCGLVDGKQLRASTILAIRYTAIFTR